MADARVDKYRVPLFGKKFPNPVETARDYALDITNAIRLRESSDTEAVQYSLWHAVVLAHIGPTVKSQVQLAWEKTCFQSG